MSASETSTSHLPAKIRSDSSAEELLEFLKAEYDRADRFCQKVQFFRDQAGIPAINEMRYAGYHLRHSLDASGRATDTEQLRKAILHCQRAIYEAAEAGLLLALREVDLFRRNYRLVSISGIVPDYVEILSTCETARQALSKGRSHGEHQLRDHDSLADLFDLLCKSANMLNAARPEINKKMEEDRRTQRRFIITVSVAALGIVVSAVIALFSEIRFWRYSDL